MLLLLLAIARILHNWNLTLASGHLRENINLITNYLSRFNSESESCRDEVSHVSMRPVGIYFKKFENVTIVQNHAHVELCVSFFSWYLSTGMFKDKLTSIWEHKVFFWTQRDSHDYFPICDSKAIWMDTTCMHFTFVPE